MSVPQEENKAVAGTNAGSLGTGDIGFTEALKYPLRGHRFTAQIGTFGITAFKSVDGFQSEISPLEYREGSWGTVGMRRVPGMLGSYPDITLTKGMYNSLDLYNYFMGYLRGESINVVDITITVYHNNGDKAAEWTAYNTWPMRYEATGLNADSSEILIETVTFATEGVYRKAV